MSDTSVKDLNGLVSTLDFLLDVLTEEEKRLISDPKCCRARDFVFENLSEDQRRVIRTGEKDEVIIAVIERMMNSDWERFRGFGHYVPKKEFGANYWNIQTQWAMTEYHIIGDPEDDFELVLDSEKYHNPERFQAWYAIRYPERVERVEKGFKFRELRMAS